jgi:hypothetical protein
MMPTEKDKAGVQQYFEDACDRFGLQPARVRYEWKVKQVEDETLAEVSTSYPYRAITLGIFPEFWNQEQDAQEEALLHEVMHVLLEPLDQHRLSHDKLFNDAEEDICDRLSIGIHRMKKLQ